MDLLAILLLILPAIFKLIDENKKKDKNRNKLPEINENNIPEWLLKLRNEAGNLLKMDVNTVDNKSEMFNAENTQAYNSMKEIKTKKEVDNRVSNEKYKPVTENQNINIKDYTTGSEYDEITEELSYFDFTGEELLKSIIISEILNKPVSKRGAR